VEKPWGGEIQSGWGKAGGGGDHGLKGKSEGRLERGECVKRDLRKKGVSWGSPSKRKKGIRESENFLQRRKTREEIEVKTKCYLRKGENNI